MIVIPPFLSIFFAQNPNLFRTQAQIGLLFAAFTLSIVVFKRWRFLTAGIVFFIFAAMAIMTFASSTSKAEWQVSMAAVSFAWLVSISLSMATVSKKSLDNIFEALAWVEIVTCCILITKWALGLDPYVWMNNHSADAAMVAVLYPVLNFRPNRFQSGKLWWSRFTAALPILAVVVAGSSTGLAAMLVMVTTYFWFHRQKPAFLIVGFLLIVTTLPGILFLRHSLMTDSGRFATWGLMMRYWWENVNVWVGSGSGSFFLLGPAVQKVNGWPDGSLFAYMHNDFLQVLFEQGILGLAAFIVFCLVICRQSIDKPWLFSALFTYGFTMLTQFPLRMFASALIGALLVRESCEKR